MDYNYFDAKGFTPLICAIYYGQIDTVNYLIRHGANVNMSAKIMPKLSPLMYAAFRNHINIIDILIKNGAELDDVSTDCDTALIISVKQGNLRMCKKLLSLNPDVNWPNRCGETALIVAIKKGHSLIVKMLLDSGADPYNVTKLNKNAIDIARDYGDNNIYNDFFKKRQKVVTIVDLTN